MLIIILTTEYLKYLKFHIHLKIFGLLFLPASYYVLHNAELYIWNTNAWIFPLQRC